MQNLLVALVIRGGVLDSIQTNCPDLFRGAKIVLVDYDTDGELEESLTAVPYLNGDVGRAFVAPVDIDSPNIDLLALVAAMEAHDATQ